MTSKHMTNKLLDRISTRKGRALYEELFKKYDVEGLTFQDKLITLGEYIQFHNGIETNEKSWRETSSHTKEEWRKRIEEESKLPDDAKLPLSEFEIKAHNELADKGMWCYYGVFLQTEGLVYCDNPKKKNLPRNKRIPLVVCYKCGQRRKAMREKRKTQQNGDHVRDGYRCTLKGETFSKLEELPCMNGLMCPNKNCMQKVDSLLKSH